MRRLERENAGEGKRDIPEFVGRRDDLRGDLKRGIVMIDMGRLNAM